MENSKLMTIKEVSEILGVSHDTIRNKIKEFFPEIIKNGITTYLNEIQVTKIKLEVEKNPNLPTNTLVGKTNLEKQLIIRQAMIFQNEIIENLQKENENLNQIIIDNKPKVEFFDTVADSKTAIEMNQVAKTIDLGFGRNELFEFLRNKKILMSNNVPYQKYIDLEYFRVIEQKYSKSDGSICINLKTLVYQKGVDFIIKLIKENKK